MVSAKKKRSTAKSKKTVSKAVAPATEKTLAPTEAKAKKTSVVTEQTPATQAETALVPRAKAFSPFAWNKWLAAVYAMQGVAILVLSLSVVYPVVLSFTTANPLADGVAQVSASHHLFDLDITWLVALLLLVAAVSHAIAATVYRKQYEAGLAEGPNRVRWFDYGLGTGLIMLVVALLSGMHDAGSLLMIFVLTLLASGIGLLTEVEKRVKHAPAFALGLTAHIVPVLVIALYFVGANVFGEGAIPAFVYWLYGTSLVYFAGFGVMLYLQCKKKGKWADYLYAERAYMIFGLLVKTAIAWQIFAGILRP